MCDLIVLPLLLFGRVQLFYVGGAAAAAAAKQLELIITDIRVNWCACMHFSHTLQ